MESGRSKTNASAQKKWTVMIYMAGDNNLEYFGVEDMNELERVGSSDEVNIVVQFDRNPNSNEGSGYSASNGDWADTRRFYIEKDSDMINFYNYTQDLNMWLLGETNMASEQTFNDFMNWCLGNYSAEHYLLVMWNHGEGIFGNSRSVGSDRGVESSNITSSGYGQYESAFINDEQESIDPEPQTQSRTRSVCNDETDGGWLNLWEMRNAFKKMKSKYEINLDIIAFDVCWIGAIETAYELIPYGDYFTGSQEEEPNPGWNYYRPISALANNPDIAPKELAIKITNAFKEEYKDGDYEEDRYMTYVAIDLNRFQKNFVQLINTFADVMSESIYDNYNVINNARRNADTPRRSSKSYMRDFFHFAKLIHQDSSATEELRMAANAIVNEYNQTILRFVHGRNHPDANGLYIYFPDKNYNNEYDSKLMFSTESWDEFLDLFLTPIQIDHTPLNDSEDSSGEFEIKAIIKGTNLDENNIYIFYNDSKTDVATPVQMIDTGQEFSAKIIINHFETRVYYYLRAADNTGGHITAPQELDFGDADTWYSFYVGMDFEPPVILHDPIEDIIAESFGEPYEFYVNITDNLGLDPNTCNLYYNTNNSVWYTEVTLNLKSYPNRYYCTLPAQPANTIIYYHFNATDLAGSRNSNSEPKGVDFEFNVSRTKPKAAFEISQLQAYTYDSLVFSSTSQPEQLIEKYIWDFGDGSAFGEHQNETHMYVEPNIYTVRLKVIDRNGLWDEVSMILEIINSPPVAEINTEAIFVNTIPR